MRTRRHPTERLLVLAGLGVASALCVALELFRERHFADSGFRFLLWNLVLAWIPLVVAVGVYDCYRRGVRLALLAPAVVAWLLFLPNAPYIVTDFVHLSPGGRTPLWYDGVMVSAFAWTGVLLGFVSLYLLHAVARHRFGPRAGWLGALATLGLTSAGVYLGRFLGWNSWDLVSRPGERLAEIAPKLDRATAVAHAAAVSLLLTALLAATYVAFYALVGLRVDPGRTR
ncbi:MAG TPA: DUF1361 domain-containing protein [Gaiellaceae bacterium]|nr:DUF1361 domain-containing protein [Gaiellaceae bacterium]